MYAISMPYKDDCSKKSNQQNIGTIKCSNFCTKIEMFPEATVQYLLPGFDKIEETVYKDIETAVKAGKIYETNAIAESQKKPVKENDEAQ